MFAFGIVMLFANACDRKRPHDLNAAMIKFGKGSSKSEAMVIIPLAVIGIIGGKNIQLLSN